jgi:branched-chain amino acid aminotransferase
MINFNGKLIAKNQFSLPYNNRAFNYGDALFETLKLQDNKIFFLEDHYFRLMASMRMLRMEIPNDFTLSYFETQILKTVAANNFIDNVRIRLQVYRKEGGLYLPKTNTINYLIEVVDLKIKSNNKYKIDLFKDYYVFSGLLSTLKTTNRIINVLSSIYASENNLDSCVLLNEKKNIVEVNQGNLFLVKEQQIFTPSITEGCIKGIMRKKIIEVFQKNNQFELIETEISPFDLQKADALFITNSIIDIQAVYMYKKKVYNLDIIKKIKKEFNENVSI